MAAASTTADERFKEASKVLEAALAKDLKDGRIFFCLGALYEHKNEKKKAAENFRTAIRLDPKLSSAYNYLGYMYVEEGIKLDEAIFLIKKAVELDPQNGAYLDSLGWAYYKKEMYEEALRELEKAASLMRDDPEIERHLEKVREKIKNTEGER